MQIGSVLYDLEPGISPNIREEIAAISMGEEPACPFLGEVQQHAVITPDMEHLLRCAESHSNAGKPPWKSSSPLPLSGLTPCGIVVRSCPGIFSLKQLHLASSIVAPHGIRV